MEIKESKEIRLPIAELLGPLCEILKRDYAIQVDTVCFYKRPLSGSGDCIVVKTKDEDDMERASITFTGTKVTLVAPQKDMIVAGCRNISLQL